MNLSDLLIDLGDDQQIAEEALSENTKTTLAGIGILALIGAGIGISIKDAKREREWKAKQAKDQRQKEEEKRRADELRPKVIEKWKSKYGSNWVKALNDSLDKDIEKAAKACNNKKVLDSVKARINDMYSDDPEYAKELLAQVKSGIFGYDDCGDYIQVVNGDQDLCIACCGVVEDIAKAVEIKYAAEIACGLIGGVGTGDGDEGCVYPSYATNKYALESATYMNQERCEQIRSKIKNSFDKIGYNRITDIDISTTDGYQIQINFDKGSDSSDVERAREICKEVLGNSWLESAPSDNRLMFTFGNANESCGDCKGGEGMILSEEFLKMTPEEQKAFLEKRKDKEFKEKDVAMDNTEQDVGSVASDLTAQEGFFSNLKKKREEKKAKEAAEAAQYDAFVKAYGPKILPILKSTQAKLANRMKRALADVAGWQTKMELDVHDIDIDDLFDYGCYLVTLGYKKGVDDDCGQREIYGIEEDLQRIIDESGRKICQLLPGNCSFHTDNGSGDDNLWEIRITVTGIDTSEFAQEAAQESSFKDMSLLDKATVIGGGVILFAALMNSIGVGNRVRELIARHKEKVRREREEKREAERKAQEALNKPIFDEYTRAMESIAKSIPAAEINKERQLRRREINELKATYQKYLNKYSKELRGSCDNFDTTTDDVKFWLDIDDVYSDWWKCDDPWYCVTADMNVIEWARNTYPKEWKEAAAKGKEEWDPIYDRCNDLCNVIAKMYTEFKNDTQNRFKTIRVIEDDWDKYEGFGFAELTASPEYLKMLRDAGFMEFDEWRRANNK